MGLCDPCKKGEHKAHTGHYSVTIKRRGDLGAKNRNAECGCATCVRRQIAYGESVGPSPLLQRTGEYTGDPCRVCGDRAHWVAVVKPEPRSPGFAHPPVDGGGPPTKCYGCPSCGVSP